MEFLMRALFLIAAVSFFIFILTLIFSIFLIVWPFIAIGVVASIAYAWFSQRIKPRDGTGPTQTTIYKSEKSIVIEHEDKKED
jgi:hypothetical protein